MQLLEKACPFCAELIKCQAVKCKHCGSFLNNEQLGSPRSQRLEAWIFVLLISVPFVLGGLLLAWYESLPPSERAHFERSAQ